MFNDFFKRYISYTGVSFPIFFLLLLVFAAGTAYAQSDIFIYPRDGQSNEELEKDKYECYSWAKGQTGFDPMQTPTASTSPPQQTEPESGALKGAFRGALVGTAVGAIAGDTGKGAAIGAASGGLVGGMRRRDQNARQQAAEQDWAQKESSRYSRERDSYDRAYSACLDGRGYTVN